LAKESQFDLQTFRAKPLPTEQEIMETWQGDKNKPVVSVLCNTFNHKLYIEDAFRGFLIQKTDFPFEVIVHDDASIDGTTDIVREYASRYPNIIKPVIQVENQYSKGRKPTQLSLPHSKGEYIAMCEGDDYWICINKLNYQLAELKNYPGIDLCFHAAISQDDRGMLTPFCDRGSNSEIVDVREVIKAGGPLMPTASFLFRRSFFNRLESYGKEFQLKYVRAYLLQVFASHPSGALYLGKPMSIYRLQAIGSWSETIKKSPEKFQQWAVSFIESVIESNEKLNKQYDLEFRYSVRKKLITLMNNQFVSVEDRSLVIRKYRDYLNFKNRFYWRIISSHRIVHFIFIRIYELSKKNSFLKGVIRKFVGLT